MSRFHSTWTEKGLYTGKWVLEEHLIWCPFVLLKCMPQFRRWAKEGMLLDQASFYPVISDRLLPLSFSSSFLSVTLYLYSHPFSFTFVHPVRPLSSDEDMLSNGGDFIIDRTGLVKYWRRTIAYERPPVSLLLDTLKANAASKQ